MGRIVGAIGAALSPGLAFRGALQLVAGYAMPALALRILEIVSFWLLQFPWPRGSASAARYILTVFSIYPCHPAVHPTSRNINPSTAPFPHLPHRKPPFRYHSDITEATSMNPTVFLLFPFPHPICLPSHQLCRHACFPTPFLSRTSKILSIPPSFSVSSRP